MSIEEVEAVRVTCDGCGKDVLVDPPLDDWPDWFSGTVDDSTYNGDGRWHACRPQCIKAAVITAACFKD